MIAQETDTDMEKKIIRSLIIARGPSGATLNEIKSDYYEQNGKEIAYKTDFNLRKWLEGIEHVKTKYSNGKMRYFSESPEQEHLTKLIRKQRNVPRTTRRGLYSILGGESTSTTKVRGTSLTSRRERMISSSLLESSINNDITFKKPKAPSQTFCFPSKPTRRTMPSTSSIVGSVHKDFSHFISSVDENNNDSSASSCSDVSKTVNLSIIAESITEKYHFNPYNPEFYKCQLVGDNFFLNFAAKQLGFKMEQRQGILQSGHCLSGMTIDEATVHIEQIGNGKLILLNIGSVDIINGRELVELLISMMRLLRVCKDKLITPILTTLAPIGNDRHKVPRVRVTDDFNDFLIRNPFKFPVIQLHKAFMKSDGKMDVDCFQQAPRFMSGFRKPIVLWSNVARQRILKVLKQEIGAAILKILVQ